MPDLSAHLVSEQETKTTGEKPVSGRGAAPGRRGDRDPGEHDEPASADGSEQVTKHFVLDTNVLLHNPNALFVFEDNHIVIPFPVIEELDKMKRRDDDIGRNARQCIRHLDRLRGLGSLIEGVDWAQAEGDPTLRKSIPAHSKTGSIRIDTARHERPDALLRTLALQT